MTSIDPNLYLNNQPQQTRTPSPEMGKDQFLELLMVQLQNQDPTKPMDDTQFMSQMAQFSSLEQMSNMSSAMDKLVEAQMVSPIIKNSHMIGKEVTYPVSADSNNVEVSTVVAISQKDGLAVLELQNGEKIYADAITEVREQSSGDKPAEEKPNVTEV